MARPDGGVAVSALHRTGLRRLLARAEGLRASGVPICQLARTRPSRSVSRKGASREQPMIRGASDIILRHSSSPPADYRPLRTPTCVPQRAKPVPACLPPTPGSAPRGRRIAPPWSQWSASNSPGRHDTRSNRSLRTPHNGSAARRTSRSDDATVPRRNRTARRWRPRGQRDARLHLQHNGGAANWCRDTDALRQQAHRGRRGRRTHWHGSAEVRSSRHSIRALPTVGHVREYTFPHPRKAPRNSSDKWTGCRRLEEPLQASVFRFVETCLTARVRRHGE